ncbi:MAG: VOC family protein [Candidatus Eremiobacteraeota bacterium]|nr:VOC family protein [Candidatus Eremiobacteraeota bacterium]
MLDHLSLPVYDLEVAARFYDAALSALGYARVWSSDDAVGYGYSGDPNEPFAIKIDSRAVPPPQRFHLAFRAESTEAVGTFYTAALENGGADDGAPSLVPEYGLHYFAAFVIDPDGHRVEAVFHGTP